MWETDIKRPMLIWIHYDWIVIKGAFLLKLKEIILLWAQAGASVFLPIEIADMERNKNKH